MTTGEMGLEGGAMSTKGCCSSLRAFARCLESLQPSRHGTLELYVQMQMERRSARGSSQNQGEHSAVMITGVCT